MPQPHVDHRIASRGRLRQDRTSGGDRRLGIGHSIGTVGDLRQRHRREDACERIGFCVAIGVDEALHVLPADNVVARSSSTRVRT